MIRKVRTNEARQRLIRNREYSIPDVVCQILADIRLRGDEAVFDWARWLDGFSEDSFLVEPDRIREALEGLEPSLRSALEESVSRVRRMARKQRVMFGDMDFDLEGVTIGHRMVPVRRVACYAPGGRYPLPSSVIMSVIPAKVAGVDEVMVLTPSDDPVMLAAAALAGADRVYILGGVQAIAAAAWGLAGVPRVDMVVGPGNRYVTAAKQMLYGEVGIDFPAGPSELLVIADADSDPEVIAADLLAQAEHDEDAVPLLFSRSGEFLDKVGVALEEQMRCLPDDSPARESVNNGLLVQLETLEEAQELADLCAPEHLELIGSEAEELAQHLRNYGSLFVGASSAEVFGDYCSGTNHILPTAGAARFTGGVWVGTFLKTLTWQRVRPEGLDRMVELAGTIAEAEGLPGHAASARFRVRETILNRG